MRVYAITGSIAVGKTTVCEALEKMGYKVISADKVVDHLYRQGNDGYKAMQIHFSQYVSGKKIKKDELLELITNDGEAKEFLESIIHPLVLAEIQKRLMAYQKSGVEIAFVEIPLLFEAHMDKYFNGSISVSCDSETQTKRLMKRNKISPEKAEALILMHMPQTQIDKKSDYIINTNTSSEKIEKQLEELLKAI